MEVCDMSKKKSKSKHTKTEMKKSTKAVLYLAAVVAILATIILIIAENTEKRIMVRNSSDIKLEYVKAYFVDSEGPVSDDEMVFENLSKGEKSKLLLDKIDLAYRQANLEIRFKFEGYDELFVDAGYFNDIFKGSISVDFENLNEGKVLLKVKANIGVLPSPNISCDEEHVVNLAEGYVEE